MIWWSFLKKIPLFGIWIIVFSVNQIVYQTDRLVAKILRIKERSPYILKGGCQQSGVCCHGIGIVLRYKILINPAFIGFMNLFYKYIYNFEYLGLKDKNTMIYACHNLSSDNSCGVYPFRPKLCREYPVTGLWKHDNVRKGCGFYFEKKEDQGKFSSVMNEKKHNIDKRVHKFSV